MGWRTNRERRRAFDIFSGAFVQDRLDETDWRRPEDGHEDLGEFRIKGPTPECVSITCSPWP